MQVGPNGWRICTARQRERSVHICYLNCLSGPCTELRRSIVSGSLHVGMPGVEQIPEGGSSPQAVYVAKAPIGRLTKLVVCTQHRVSNQPISIGLISTSLSTVIHFLSLCEGAEHS